MKPWSSTPHAPFARTRQSLLIQFYKLRSNLTLSLYSPWWTWCLNSIFGWVLIVRVWRFLDLSWFLKKCFKIFLIMTASIKLGFILVFIYHLYNIVFIIFVLLAIFAFIIFFSLASLAFIINLPRFLITISVLIFLLLPPFVFKLVAIAFFLYSH